MNNKAIKELQDKIAEAEKTIKVCTSGIGALRHICTHEWSYTGHNHNDNIYEC